MQQVHMAHSDGVETNVKDPGLPEPKNTSRQQPRHLWCVPFTKL